VQPKLCAKLLLFFEFRKRGSDFSRKKARGSSRESGTEGVWNAEGKQQKHENTAGKQRHERKRADTSAGKWDGGFAGRREGKHKT